MPFDPAQHLQRPALLLANGNVYIAFGSHGDTDPFHGWIISYKAANGQGNIYAVTSNGDTDMTVNFSDSVIRLDATATKVADWFSPANVQDLNDEDGDLGTSGAMLIPGTNYLATAGKQGVIYLLDRTNPGHVAANDSQVTQRFDTGNSLIFNMALWNRPGGPLLYTHAANACVTAYQLLSGKLSATPVATSLNGFPVPYQGMTLSANGTQAGSGILWVLAPSRSPVSPAVLHAYNAEDLTELWTSRTNDADAPGAYVKFVNPTVANGKVYVPPASNQLAIYGLTSSNPAASAPAVTAIVNAASYANSQLAPGESVALIGQSLGPQDMVWGATGGAGVPGTQLAGTQVTFNGIPAPLFSSSDGLVIAAVPYEIAGG